jgi:hypothetical protein
MKTQSTYAMLVNSKEKGRDLFEGAVYSLIAVCTAIIGFAGAMQSDSIRNYSPLAKQEAPAPIVAKAAVAQNTRG